MHRWRNSSSPTCWIASYAGPVEARARAKVSGSGNSHAKATSWRRTPTKPASARTTSPTSGRPSDFIRACASTFSGAARVNGIRAQRPGDSFTWPHVVRPIRPPGRRTRTASAIASGVVAQRPRKLVTTSNESSAHGSAAMSPTWTSPSGTRSAAIATSLGDASMPATNAPRARASSSERPEPHATSSSRSPSRTSSAWCTVTYSRQAAGSRSVANSTARRPQPSSTVSHWSVIAAPQTSP